MCARSYPLGINADSRHARRRTTAAHLLTAGAGAVVVASGENLTPAPAPHWRAAFGHLPSMPSAFSVGFWTSAGCRRRCRARFMRSRRSACATGRLSDTATVVGRLSYAQGPPNGEMSPEKPGSVQMSPDKPIGVQMSPENERRVRISPEDETARRASITPW